MSDAAEPTLYGIKHSNRKPKDFWGKNQFNSVFPVSLACYMRDKGIEAQYVHVDSNLDLRISPLPFDKVFGTSIPNEDLIFNFESKFDAYQAYASDDIKNIDLVVASEAGPIRPLEIKLTVLPDSSSCESSEEKWGSEIVIRPASTYYATLGIYHNVIDRKNEALDIISPVAENIKQWDNGYEMSAHFPSIMETLNTFQRTFINVQQPFLMQTIWKTLGKSPLLCENAFDIFVWSDFALYRLFMNRARKKVNHKLRRTERSTVRLIRCLYDALSKGRVSIQSIYTEIAFGHQTDKEFAVSGKVTNPYLACERLLHPKIHKDSLVEIILNGGEINLSPERRLDQSVFIQTVMTKNKDKL